MRAATPRAQKRRPKANGRRAAPGLAELSLGPTEEQRAQHLYEPVDPARLDSREQAIGRAWRNRSGTPLDRYFARGRLDADQFAAGERLRSDWYRAGLETRITPVYGPKVSASGGAFGHTAMSELQAMARQRWRRALEAVGGALAAVLVDVVCLERGAGEVGRRFGRAGRNAEIAGMTALQLALDGLAQHYGISRRDPRGRGGGQEGRIG